jgi:uncharacterized membrane protein YkvA (DUF1232 family)
MTIANDANSLASFSSNSGSAGGHAVTNGGPGGSADGGSADGSNHAHGAGAGETGPGRPPVREWLGRSVMKATEALGQRYLARLAGARGNLNQSLQAVPERMHRSARQAQLVLELLDDVRSGVYREVRWYSVTVAAAAMLYAVSPADIIPDVLPLVGAFDDVALIALAVRMLRRDLVKYCRFKGYPEEQYFGASS